MPRQAPVVKIYRRSSRQSFSKGKPSYKYYRRYMPIPARFKPVVEPFLAKDLAVEVRAVERGQLLLIMAQEQLPDETS